MWNFCIIFAHEINKQILNRMDKKIEKIKKLPLCECKAEDVVEYFESESLLDQMDSQEIADFIEENDHILSLVSDATLVGCVEDEGELLDAIDLSSMICDLEMKGYTVIYPDEEENILERIENICRTLQPKGYMGKEEAKKVLCDYIDFWMNSSF